MKKTWIGLSTAIATFPAVAIAVPLSLNQTNANPDGTTIHLAAASRSLVTIGETVVIDVNSAHLHGNIQWNIVGLKDNVEKESQDNDSIVFILKKHPSQDYSFSVTAKNNGVTSNTITIEVIAPTEDIQIGYLGDTVLARQGDTVTIKRMDINPATTYEWKNSGIPTSVRILDQNDRQIVFQAIEQITGQRSSFTVWCFVDGNQSNMLSVDLIPPVTTISVSFENNIDLLSGVGSSVTVIANVQNQDEQPLHWNYNLPGTESIQVIPNPGTNSITFIAPSGITTNGSFFVSASNNGATSNNITVRMKITNKASTIQIFGEGVVWDGKHDTGNKHISSPVWRPGTYDYNVIFYDADGNPDTTQDAFFFFDPDDQTTGLKWEVFNNGAGDSKIRLSWQAGYSGRLDTAAIAKFTVYSVSKPELQAQRVTINVDFYSITSVSWVGTQPSSLSGANGLASFNAKCNGQGVIGDSTLDWEVLQQDGTVLPTTDWTWKIEPGLPSTEQMKFSWAYTGTKTAILNLTVYATSHANPDKFITTNVTLTAKETKVISISGSTKITTNMETSGSSLFTANYLGTEPDTNTEWTISVTPSTLGISKVIDTTDNSKMSLTWDDTLNAVDYVVTITAKWHEDPTVVYTNFTTTIHSRGDVTNLDPITWPGSQTNWGGNYVNGAAYNVHFTSKVNGTNVDPDINWLYGNVSSYGNASYIINIDKNGNLSVSAITDSLFYSGWVKLTVNAKSVQDNSKFAGSTVQLTFSFLGNI